MAAALVEQTYDKLLQMILQQKLRPGDRLPSEIVLCDQFSVSRNTLRAALNKLDVLGFTTTRQGGGTYVKAVGSEVYLNFFVPAVLTHNLDLLEIMQFRRGIETEAARLAARNYTEEDAVELAALLRACKGSKADMDRFAAANTDFHSCVAKASHNKMFKVMMEIIRVMLLPEMQDFLTAQGRDIDSTFYHEMVLRCILNHKPDEAAFFMSQHLSLIEDRVREYVAVARAEQPPRADAADGVCENI